MPDLVRKPFPVLAAALAALLLAPAPAAQAQPAPFGHACTAQDGVRFCPTTDLASRVPSWDGVPLDVDVTLPPSGEGPFPTLLLLHGLGLTKASLEGPGGDPHYNNVFFARRGYAVVTPTARGFGNSCGVPASRTAGCEHGWTRLGDIRYEVRDMQYLTGLLVDQGIAEPRGDRRDRHLLRRRLLDHAGVPARPRAAARRPPGAVEVALGQAHLADRGLAPLALDQRRGDLRPKRPRRLVAQAARRSGSGVGRPDLRRRQRRLRRPAGVGALGRRQRLEGGCSTRACGDPGPRRSPTTPTSTTASPR